MVPFLAPVIVIMGERNFMGKPGNDEALIPVLHKGWNAAAVLFILGGHKVTWVMPKPQKNKML